MAADTEVNWKGPPPAGSKPDLRIWRVENNQGGKCPFGIRPWPVKDYGRFFDGDSYIVLKTFKKARSKKLCHDVFFWLGLESSIGTFRLTHIHYSLDYHKQTSNADEKGVAAYKTVELDDFLGGAAKQHRLVQGNESERFLRCFKAPPVIMHGGIASGFKKVKINANKTSAGGKDPILRKVRKRGRRYVVSVVDVAESSLNDSDVFILDCGNVLYQYNGPKSSGFEKNRAQQEVAKVSKKRHKTSGIVVKHVHVHEGDKSKFWKILGGSSSSKKDNDVSPPEPPLKMEVSSVKKSVAEDDELLRPEDDDEMLLRPDDDESGGGKMSVLHGDEFGGYPADVQIIRIISDKDGMPVFTKELEGTFGDFNMDVLKSDGMYVVDGAMKDGDTVWLWSGNDCDKSLKMEAMLMIESYLCKSAYPNCPVTMLKECDDDLPLDFQKIFDSMGDVHDNGVE